MLSTRLSLENQKVVRSFVDDGLKLYLPMNGPNINTGLRLLGAGSMEFDGTNDYVLCGDDTSLDITDDITMMAWVKPATAGQTSHIAGRDKSGQQSYSLNINGSNKYEFVFYVSGGAHKVTSSTADTANVWVHLACTRHKSSGKNIIYVNGVAEDTDTDSTAAIDNDDVQFSIGATGDFGSDFRGTIKNVAIWNRAITATEVQNVMYKSYEEVSGRLLSGMVSWWKLEESVVALATKAADSHGSNTGTITGATVAASGSGSKYGGVVPTLPRMVDNSPKVQADAIGSGSAYFDNTYTDYITGDDTGFPATSSARTVTFWMNADSVTTYGMMFAYGTNSSSNAFVISWDDSNANITVGKYGGNADSASSTTISLNTWHHIAVTHDGSSTITYYLNGVADGTATLASLNTTLDAFLIGDHLSGWGGANSFDGNICQVGIWDAVLDQAQIQSIMEKTYEELTASEKTNLVSYWALDETTYAEDLTGGLGTMEAGSGWVVFGSPVNLAYSTSKFYEGSQSLHVTDCADDKGAQLSSQFSIVTGEKIYVDAWVYVVDGTKVQVGMNGTTESLFVEKTVTANTWTNITQTFNASSSTSTYVLFSAEDGYDEFYVDSVTAKKVAVADSTDNNNYGILT